MTEKKKGKIKVVDINSDNFFNETESYFDKHSDKSNSDSFLTKLIIVAVILSFVLIGLVVFAPFDKINTTKLSALITGKNKTENNAGGFDLFKKRENILVLGVDSNGDGADAFENTRTDTIMVISLDNASKSVNVISIPRDSKVYIAGTRGGLDKINAAHAIGGIPLTIKTIQDMFGIKIDHYLLVNYEGLNKIVEAFGTIPVNVEKKLRYKDYAGHLFVNLDPGKHDLDAKQVEQFVRFRHDAIGDIGRIDRQRMLMKGLMQRMQSPDVIAKLPEIIKITNEYVKTDMTVFDLTRYAGIAKSINLDDVEVATLPGHPSQNSSISYWILEPDRVQSIIDSLVYRIEPENSLTEPMKISILYNGISDTRLEEIKTALGESNIEIVCSQRTKRLNPEVIAHNDKVATKRYKQLKSLVPELVHAHKSISYDVFYCADSDATLVLVQE